ncbi:MAG: protein kinase [Deltaproteobacteria bacterium]|nr:protein kinase [Deltaproteobacteria bacterium]
MARVCVDCQSSPWATASFIAPEQINVQRLDGRADLWAFGVSLYWMLTGRLPFRGKNHIQTLKSILHKDPPLPSTYNSEIEAPVERLVMNRLKKDPPRPHRQRVAGARTHALPARRPVGRTIAGFCARDGATRGTLPLRPLPHSLFGRLFSSHSA